MWDRRDFFQAKRAVERAVKDKFKPGDKDYI